MHWGQFTNSAARKEYYCVHECGTPIAIGEVYYAIAGTSARGKFAYRLHRNCFADYIDTRTATRRVTVQAKRLDRGNGRELGAGRDELEITAEARAVRIKTMNYIVVLKKVLVSSYLSNDRDRVFRSKNTLARKLRELFEDQDLGGMDYFKPGPQLIALLGAGIDPYISPQLLNEALDIASQGKGQTKPAKYWRYSMPKVIDLLETELNQLRSGGVGFVELEKRLQVGRDHLLEAFNTKNWGLGAEALKQISTLLGELPEDTVYRFSFGPELVPFTTTYMNNHNFPYKNVERAAGKPKQLIMELKFIIYEWEAEWKALNPDD